MYRSLRNFLGGLKRASQGLWQNNFDKAVKINPNLFKYQIGESAGHKAIFCYQIGTGSIKVLFMAGIHGNEVGTVKLSHQLINHLFKQQQNFKDFSFFIVPCLNPDGYELALKNPNYKNGGRIGRFNANKVDLNRNFDTPSFEKSAEWCFGKNYAERSEVYCGEMGGSEPEIKALTSLIQKENIKILFTFHNVGQDVMGSKDKLAQKLSKIYSEAASFREVHHKSWQELGQTGTAAEWCNLNNISYIEVEGSNRWGSDWKRQKPAIEASLKELSSQLQTSQA